MKSIKRLLLAAVLVAASSLLVQAQGKLSVSTRLQETNGTYDQRKLCREFLTDYMKNCPYISQFEVREVPGDTDNHEVIWSYNVRDWDGITSFYHWIDDRLKAKDGGLKTALTPYAPSYAIGGDIQVNKKSKDELAREKPLRQKNREADHG